MRLKKPVTIDDLITTERFAQMMGIDINKLYYRLKNNQIYPPPMRFGWSLIFEANAKIVIPERKKGGGRPKGSTKANGAQGRGYPRAREGKLISRKRINRLTND